ncbi:hypothetical protein MJO28_007398 [Puccinia striiformis f. sp. tritici]|uniref:Uncharacterized protein n=3 Tax=Puccinia striiformis TaxID=27350 RepID=A0A2S4VKN2_9BASI|nr:hypothetical protein MJO28_007398 [Puccinia striiformis f. sp. tritici]POW10116.1 hypothetical protein PSTT_06345 [Puccinia striiformis]
MGTLTYHFFIVSSLMTTICHAFDPLLPDQAHQLSVQHRQKIGAFDDVWHPPSHGQLDRADLPSGSPDASIHFPEVDFEPTMPSSPEESTERKSWPWINAFEPPMPFAQLPDHTADQDSKFPRQLKTKLADNVSLDTKLSQMAELSNNQFPRAVSQPISASGDSQRSGMPSEAKKLRKEMAQDSRLLSNKKPNKRRKIDRSGDPNEIVEIPAQIFETTASGSKQNSFEKLVNNESSSEKSQNLGQDFKRKLKSHQPSPIKESPISTKNREQITHESTRQRGGQLLIDRSQKSAQKLLRSLIKSRNSLGKFEKNLVKRVLNNFGDPNWNSKIAEQIMLRKKADGSVHAPTTSLRFDKDAFFDQVQQQNTLQGFELKHELGPIFRSMGIYEGHQLAIPEYEFKEFMAFKYAPLRYHDKEESTSEVWVAKLAPFFKKNLAFWEKRFNTLIDLDACLKLIKFKRFKKVFPVYLFYVQMINSIVPRPKGKELNEETELVIAATTFIHYSQTIKKALIDAENVQAKSIDTIVEQENRNPWASINLAYFQTMLRADDTRSKLRVNLWAFLDVWLENNRSQLFVENQTETGLFSLRGRMFFNEIFIFSIHNLSKMLSNR